jgi:aminopeptidase
MNPSWSASAQNESELVGFARSDRRSVDLGAEEINNCLPIPARISGMDARIREHAEIIAEHSVDLQEGDNVVVLGPPQADDLVTALHEVIGDVGANPVALNSNSRFSRAFLRASEDDFDTPDHEQALIQETDVYIAIRANENVTESSDVDPETNAAYSKAKRPILNKRLSKRWCLTQYPAPANAQLAEMSTEAYENFVWDAINKDWDAVREHQAQMVEILDPAEEVRIVSGDTTDVTMRIDGNPTLNDYGEKNLPGGEVFTAPIPDSVEGEVLFDKPLYHQGREVTDVYLEFEDGEVVDHSAEKNEEVLTEVLETDEGARRLGELGIGMNRDIDQFTYNMLFDEKMGDTVHMAVGRAYEDTVGEDNEQNESAVHVDMIVDMGEDSRIEVDGEVVQKNGTFRFEDGFEG